MNIAEIVGTGALIVTSLLLLIGMIIGSAVLWEKSAKWAPYWRGLLAIIYFLLASLVLGFLVA